MISSSHSQQPLLNLNELIPNLMDRNSGRSTAQNKELSRLSNVASIHSQNVSRPNSIRFSFGISNSQLTVKSQP